MNERFFFFVVVIFPRHRSDQRHGSSGRAHVKRWRRFMTILRCCPIFLWRAAKDLTQPQAGASIGTRTPMWVCRGPGRGGDDWCPTVEEEAGYTQSHVEKTSKAYVSAMKGFSQVARQALIPPRYEMHAIKSRDQVIRSSMAAPVIPPAASLPKAM